MREDLLKTIKGATDVTNAVILTHNIDFVFVESMVIPALRKCGSPPLIIFADVECASSIFQHQGRVLSSLGVRYRVVPVQMEPGFHFHPKALLLSGPPRATLLVGSGNLTFGGWRENGEIWTRFDSDKDGTAVFASFHNYLRQVLKLTHQENDLIATAIDEAFDSKSRSWAANLEPASGLLVRAGQGASMLDQMKSLLEGRRVDRLYVCAPYFDEEGTALRSISQGLGARMTTVLVQSGRTNLLSRTASALGPEFAVSAAKYVHREKAGPDGEERTREALLHAKFYAVDKGDEVLLFAGSANCSRAALTIPGSAGNAELMTYMTLDHDRFKRAFLDELVLDDLAPLLATEPAEKPTVPNGGVIQVRSARLELGRIRVVFQTDDVTAVHSAEIDDISLKAFEHGDQWMTFQTTVQARMITLIGYHQGCEVRSLAHWIDNEYQLRASARGRSLAESIDSQMRVGTWGIGAWTEVLSELHKHIRYMPTAVSHGPARLGSNTSKSTPQSGPVEFVWEDVFADSYRLRRRGISANYPLGSDGRINGLRSMLLRWFGIVQPEADVAADASEDAETSPSGSNAGDDGDHPDKPAELPKTHPRPTVAQASENERKRALKLIKQITARLAEADYLSARPPELLAADLKVASVLLRAGVADKWITDPEFFESTLKIWLPLFFNATGNEATGWLEQRYLTEPNQEEFAMAIQSVELAAALGCWALSTPPQATSPNHARFELASALGVARLPWLWQTGGNEQVAKEMSELLALTARGDELNWDSVERRWLKLIRRGRALSLLEKAMSDIKPADVRARIKQPKVQAGELLWQKPYGFCVARTACDRAVKQNVEVLILRQGDAPKSFTAPFLIPVSGLLGDGVLEPEAMPSQACKELAAMVEELRVGLSRK